LKEFLKRLNIWQSYEENVDCLKCSVSRALSCWKMKNLLKILRISGRKCYSSITLRLILSITLTPWSTKYYTGVGLMSTTCYSVTDAVTDWTLIVGSGVLSRSLSSYGWWLYVYSWSFCEFVCVVIVNIFSPVKKMLSSFARPNILSANVLNGRLLHGSSITSLSFG